jgi:endo-1,4-beta-xylanase
MTDRDPHASSRTFLKTRREFLAQAASVGVAAGLSAIPPMGCSQAKAGPMMQPAAPTLNDVSGPRSLRASASAHGLLVGCAVNPDHLDGETDYARTVADQASILVPENAMKWAALRPNPTQYDFRKADDIVAFALSHEQKVRGHNLCWHESIPAWFAGTVTRDNAAQYLTQHIQTVAARYAGKLHSWDVVNEAVNLKDGRPDGLRNSPWLQLIGPSYLELAFRTAREADRTALLTYNDYGIELDTPEQIDNRGQVLVLVRRLKARSVPIDAVGIQSHLTAGDVPGPGLIRFIRELAAMDLQVFITELDVNDRKLPEEVSERDTGVARTYREYLTSVLAEPNVTALLTWGITDRYTWLNGSPHASRADGKPERPLPFDYDYNPKPAFFAERDAIATRAADAVPGADHYAPFNPAQPQRPQAE